MMAEKQNKRVEAQANPEPVSKGKPIAKAEDEENPKGEDVSTSTAESEGF